MHVLTFSSTKLSPELLPCSSKLALPHCYYYPQPKERKKQDKKQQKKVSASEWISGDELSCSQWSKWLPKHLQRSRQWGDTMEHSFLFFLFWHFLLSTTTDGDNWWHWCNTAVFYVILFPLLKAHTSSWTLAVKVCAGIWIQFSCLLSFKYHTNLDGWEGDSRSSTSKLFALRSIVLYLFLCFCLSVCVIVRLYSCTTAVYDNSSISR